MSLAEVTKSRDRIVREATRASRGLAHRWALDIAPTLAVGRVCNVGLGVRVPSFAQTSRHITCADNRRLYRRGNI